MLGGCYVCLDISGITFYIPHSAVSPHCGAVIGLEKQSRRLLRDRSRVMLTLIHTMHCNERQTMLFTIYEIENDKS